MLDIDDFKQVNDEYGHQQGDEVLTAVAGVLRELSRDIDLPARYGGEELAVVLPQTDAEGAAQVAERMREAIEACRIPSLDGDRAAQGHRQLRRGRDPGQRGRQGGADRRRRRRALPRQAVGQEPGRAGRARGRLRAAGLESAVGRAG